MHSAIRAESRHAAEPSRFTFFAVIGEFGYRTAQGVKALRDKCRMRRQRSGLRGERVTVDAGHTWPISRCARRPDEARVAGLNYSDQAGCSLCHQHAIGERPVVMESGRQSVSTALEFDIRELLLAILRLRNRLPLHTQGMVNTARA